MSEQMTPNEVVAHLRDLASLYESMRVDHLQRSLLRKAADTIDHLTSELEACRRRADSLEPFVDDLHHAITLLSCPHEILDSASNLIRQYEQENSPEPGGEETE